MENYKYLRIDKDSVIKCPRRTGGTGSGSIFLYFSETENPNETPLEIGGEMADGLRSWIAGTHKFPINPSGILDIYGVVVDGIAAVRALEGDTPINFPLELPSAPMLRDIAPPQTHNSPVPVVDIEKVARAIKERK